MQRSKQAILFLLAVAIAVPAILGGAGQPVADRPPFELAPGRIAGSLPSNRTSSIVITSDADYPLYASSGSGAAGDPWILENYLVECNGTGGGITISGCDDHAIIRNSYINETDAVSAGIGIQGSSNIVIDNITVESGLLGFAFISSHDVVLNNSFAYSYSLGGVYTDSSWDITIQNTQVEMRGANGAPIYLGNLNTGNGSTRVTVQDCTLVGNATTYLSYSIGSTGITFTGTSFTNGTRIGLYTSSGMTFTGCTIGDGASTTGLDLNNVDDLAVISCVFNVTGFGIDGRTASHQDDSITVIDSNCSGKLLALEYSDTVMVSGCHATGLQLEYCSSAVIIDNVLLDTGTNAITITGMASPRESGYNITGNVMRNCSDEMLLITNVDDIIIEDNTMSDTADIFIRLAGVDNVTMASNDLRYCHDLDMITLDPVSTNIAIDGNYFYSPGNATSTCDAGIWIDTAAGSGFTIVNNIFDTINDTTNGNAILIYGTNTGILVQNNTFTGNNRAFVSTSTDVNVTGNYFYSTVAGWFLAGTNVTVTSNYYRDYFNVFPTAVTINASTDVLENEYAVLAGLNDTRPLYREDWFPRDEQVFFRFYSDVDYQGVPFEQVQLYIDGERVTTASPMIEHVLFDVLVYDYSGRLLHDQVYNINGSGIYINIGLDITVAVHFRFYSTLDYFGLPFELVKLYVNGTRITTPSPTMRPAIINVVVRDYADIVIYNATVDLATSGIYLDIGLALAPITVVNDYNRTVVFTLIRGTATTRLAMASGMQLDLRLALGDYSYIISETNGTVLATNDVTFSSASPAGFVISFGWTELTPGTITVYQAQLLDYVFMIALFGLITGAVVFVAFRVQHATPARGARAIPSKPSVSFPTIKLHNPFSKKEHAGRRGSSAFVRIFHDRW